MRLSGKSVFAKTGAEGGYALTLFDKGWGAALKIDDGNQRALGPAVIELLQQLGVLSTSALAQLKNYHHPAILNHRKEQVGELQPSFRLA
jgi:L-asparaginase II